MAEKFDFKKEYKDLYLPKAQPMIIDVPEMVFFMVDGKGNPNTSEEYKNAMEVLYGLSYSIKMSKMNGTQPEGYYDYVVPPLEGLWNVGEKGINYDGMMIVDKEQFTWTSMIRQPEFVTEEVFEKAKKILLKKKPQIDLSTTRFVKWTEGLCVQIMHTGTYDSEPADVKKMEKFIAEQGYKNDISEIRRHHEIYLGDPRKTKPENLKTVIRHPIAKL